jgi:3-hydroxyisobutyrate dehydrogenase-like beta-hydroxyacid dehydrogenase
MHVSASKPDEPVAFIGLGAMGAPMAANLVRRGISVFGIARRQAALAELAAAGARTSTNPADANKCTVVFLCLPDSAAVRTLFFDGSNLQAGFRKGQIVVDTSTIEYRAATDIAATLAGHGITYIDAPITGMAQRAREGTLTVMCGGEKAPFEHVTPLLQCFASQVLYLGKSGNGQLAKLVNQLLFDINAAAIAEILPMAVKLGLEPELVGSIVNNGTGRSYASEFFIPNILQGRFDQGYPLQAAYKDLLSGIDIAMTHRIPTPLLAAATATYQQALLRGHGALDKGAMIRVFEELLGTEFRKVHENSQ